MNIYNLRIKSTTKNVIIIIYKKLRTFYFELDIQEGVETLNRKPKNLYITWEKHSCKT